MVMLAVALVGLATLVPLQHHQTAQQRERERELLWVGEQYRQAIASFHAASPGLMPTYPRSLQELLQDPRYAQPRRHLRRLYADPFTGQSDWVLIAPPGQPGIAGVASAATVAPLKRHGFAPAQSGFDAALTVAEWRFVHDAQAAAAAPSPGIINPESPQPDPPEPPAAPPAPAAPPISPDARAQCLQTLSQASNACLALPAEEAMACRQRAREALLRCVRGGN